MIELNQGDSDDISFVLKKDGVGVDLTRSNVSFIMKKDTGDTKYIITCISGSNMNGTQVLYSSGGVTVPISAIESAEDGIFYGYFLVNEFGLVKTYPNNTSSYIKIKINKAF